MEIRTAGGSKDDKEIGREGGRKERGAHDSLGGMEEGKEGVRNERKEGKRGGRERACEPGSKSPNV